MIVGSIQLSSPVKNNTHGEYRITVLVRCQTEVLEVLGSWDFVADAEINAGSIGLVDFEGFIFREVATHSGGIIPQNFFVEIRRVKRLFFDGGAAVQKSHELSQVKEPGR